MSTMLTTPVANNYSKELKKLIPKFEKGKKYEFRSLKSRKDKKTKKMITPASQRVLNHDTIYDPGTSESIDIMCIARKVPNGRGYNGSDVELREIFFERSMNGSMILDGNNRRDENLFKYLFLSSYNRANAKFGDTGKPAEFHQKPRNGYIFEYIEPDKTAEKKVNNEERIYKAKGIVFALADKDLKYACETLANATALDGKTSFRFGKTLDQSQLKERLLQYVEKHPAKAKLINFEFLDEYRKMLAIAKDTGIIEFDESKGYVVMKSTGDNVLNIKSSKDPETKFVHYLLSEKGAQVHQEIISQLEELQKDQTSSESAD